MKTKGHIRGGARWRRRRARAFAAIGGALVLAAALDLGVAGWPGATGAWLGASKTFEAATVSTLTVGSPSNLTATASGSTCYQVSWTHGANSDKTDLYRSNSGGPWSLVDQVASDSYTDCSPGTSTAYSVVGHRAANWVSGSAGDVSVTPAALITPCSVTAMSAASILGTYVDINIPDNVTLGSGDSIASTVITGGGLTLSGTDTTTSGSVTIGGQSVPWKFTVSGTYIDVFSFKGAKMSATTPRATLDLNLDVTTTEGAACSGTITLSVYS